MEKASMVSVLLVNLEPNTNGQLGELSYHCLRISCKK